MIFQFFAFSGSGAKCPDGFPSLERHTESDHGDVCRNEKGSGLNVGWNCVSGCVGRNSAPWCVQSGTPNSPCRASRIIFHTIISFILFSIPQSFSIYKYCCFKLGNYTSKYCKDQNPVTCQLILEHHFKNDQEKFENEYCKEQSDHEINCLKTCNRCL